MATRPRGLACQEQGDESAPECGIRNRHVGDAEPVRGIELVG